MVVLAVVLNPLVLNAWGAHPSGVNGLGVGVIVTGELVESMGRGQSVEIKADAIEVVGFVLEGASGVAAHGE